MTISNQLPSLYQQFIHKSRYARWIWEENRRETWDETVARYFNFFEEHLLENNNFKLDKKIRAELEEAVLTLKVMPSMRCLMTAGEALRRENVSGYNCLAYETNVLTKERGYAPIGSLKDEKVSVLNSDGTWSATEVKSYGEQSLMKVRFHYNGNSKHEEVYATEDHDWIVDGVRVQTKNLKKGMKIPFVLKSRLPVYNDDDYKKGIIHGLIYGDGTQLKYKTSPQDKNVVSCERIKGYMIRLCDDHEDLLPFFEEYTKSYPSSYNGDPVVYLYDNFAKTHELKSLPSRDETESYMIGFFRGWLAADGSVGKNGQVSICVGKEEEEWLRSVMPVFGIHFHAKSKILAPKTNFRVRKKESRSLEVWRPSLQKDDFIIKRKRDRFIPLKIERSVIDVQHTNRKEEVFCVSVPNYRNFVIERGILTGNCSYLAVDSPRSFDEILYILMNGTGVGFSVESKYVEQLPVVSDQFFPSDTTIVVADSKLGWAKSLKELIHLLYSGQIPQWDLSKVRPAGAPLKTFGGRASGPAPLNDLFNFCVAKFKGAAGRRLSTLECHDIVCKIAEIVVVGGVRRSALISLSDLNDDRMRVAKSGEWWKDNVQRALANNSFVAKDKVDVGIFMKEWLSLYESHSGERGIFSRTASQKQVEKFGRRDPNHDFGTNPCCLIGSTELVTQEHGKKTIKDVVELFSEDKRIHVLAFNTQTENVEWVAIEAAQLTRPNAEVIELEIETAQGTKTIRCTPDHPIYTQNRGYVRADEITEDDELVIMETKTIIGRLKSRRAVTNEDTYDIQTPTHNFFANDILVHNSEIILRSREFCNLTEAVVRGTDDVESLKQKVRVATILGVMQSTLTNFKYLSKKWKENCEEERLLGVSLTGIMDNEFTNGKSGVLKNTLNELRNVAQDTAKEWADKIGIPVSASITCVKPSGCFEKTQKIKTDKGDLSFDEIFKMNGIELNEKENEYREWYDVTTDLKVYDENNEEQTITKLFVNGVEETIKITLENGEVIECTPNHKFKLSDGSWKRAEHLTEHDDIMTW